MYRMESVFKGKLGTEQIGGGPYMGIGVMGRSHPLVLGFGGLPPPYDFGEPPSMRTPFAYTLH